MQFATTFVSALLLTHPRREQYATATQRRAMTMCGVIVFNAFGNVYPEFATQRGDWIAQRRIDTRIHLFDRQKTDENSHGDHVARPTRRHR